jgi:uncharacterized membrane protein YjdF
MKARVTRLTGIIFLMSLWLGGARAQNQQLVHIVQGLVQKYKAQILEVYGAPQTARSQAKHEADSVRYSVVPQH